MKTAIELIAEERARQISVEGWTPEHDDAHTDAEMATAAACYAKAAQVAATWHREEAKAILGFYPEEWPWSITWWKPSTDPVRNLAKAGALIAAEIDRLQRVANTGDVARPAAQKGTNHERNT